MVNSEHCVTICNACCCWYVKLSIVLKKYRILLLQIQVGLIQEGHIVRGSRQVVSIAKNSNAAAVLSAACCRLATFNKTFDANATWKLKYPDASDVVNLPGSTEAFTLMRYREELMKDYQKIVLYVARGKLY